MATYVDTIVFDLGGVLIDWNPRYLYQQVFDDPRKMEEFLTQVCSPHWNEQQDEGRSFKEAVEQLLPVYPQYTEEIKMYDTRWEEMLGGTIEESVTILEELLEKNRFKLYALTNWSEEKFPVALQKYDFLKKFNGILVSGQERLKKPNPQIYQRLFQKFSIDPTHALFIDDSLPNVQIAQEMGMSIIHFQSPSQLKKELLASYVI